MALGGVAEQLRMMGEQLTAIQAELEQAVKREIDFAVAASFIGKLLPHHIQLIIYNCVLNEIDPLLNIEVKQALIDGRTLFIPELSALGEHRVAIESYTEIEKNLASQIRKLCDQFKKPDEPILTQFMAALRKERLSQSASARKEDEPGVSFMRNTGFFS